MPKKPLQRLAIMASLCLSAGPLSAAVVAEHGDAAAGGKAADTFAALGALTVKGRLMRDSELGDEGYRPELSGEPMGEVGRIWLDLLYDARQDHVDGGELRDRDQPDEPGSMAVHAEAAYLYHMHHSAGRFADHDLFEALTHEPSPLLSQLSQHLLQERYSDGRFHYPGSSEERIDGPTMAHGLDALHAVAYAWVRWDKPGGSDDMGRLDEEMMQAWMGHDLDELVATARDLASTLDAHWDDEAGVYSFDGTGTTWAIDDLGALVRGHKGIYEILHIFGDDADRDEADELFDRAAAISRAVLGDGAPITDWGLPAEVRFSDGTAHAAADHIDVAAQWRLVHQITGGFSILRERDGTSDFLDERDPYLAEEIGDGIDRLLSGALAYQLVDGFVVAELNAEDGSVRDDRITTQAVTAFVRGVGNGYRTGTAFDRPGAWAEDEALAERSEQLYDSFLEHGQLLTSELLR